MLLCPPNCNRCKIIDSLSIAPDERLAASLEAMEPFGSKLDPIRDEALMLARNEGPDAAMKHIVKQLAELGHANAMKALAPFATQEARSLAIGLAAQFNRIDCVEALLPYSTPDDVRKSIISYLNAGQPRDRRIFDLLWSRADRKQVGFMFSAAIRNEHLDLALELIPYSFPWENCSSLLIYFDRTSPSFTLIERVWAQSIMNGNGPLPPKDNARAQHWAQNLPKVAAAIEHVKIATRTQPATPDVAATRKPGLRL